MTLPERVNSLLIVKLSSIGDVIQSLPVAAALRRRFPSAHVAWAVKPGAADAVIGNPNLSETLVLGGCHADGATVRSIPPLTAPIALARAMRSHGFDVAVDMQGLLKSALVAYLSGAPVRVGFANRQEGAFLLNNWAVVPDRRDVHAVESYLGFADAFNAPAYPLDFTIAASEADREAVDRLLAGMSDVAALVPGARWLSKRWPPGRFGAVADALAAEYGVTSIIVGARSDAPLAAEIAASASTPVADLTGKTTLKQLAELFRRCRAVVSNETGPMYIASAVGAPTVAIFGPTNSSRLGPYGEGHAKVASGLSCRPCRRRSCQPLKCMEAVSIEQVLAAAREIIRPIGPGGGACQPASANPA